MESVGYYEKAIDAFIACQNWNRALECATQVRPQELSAQFKKKINDARSGMYAGQGRVDKIVKGGDIQAGLNIYAQNGQWEECLNLAEK